MLLVRLLRFLRLSLPSRSFSPLSTIFAGRNVLGVRSKRAKRSDTRFLNSVHASLPHRTGRTSPTPQPRRSTQPSIRFGVGTETSRATTEFRENILASLSGKNILEFCFLIWRILLYFVFLSDGGATKRR